MVFMLGRNIWKRLYDYSYFLVLFMNIYHNLDFHTSHMNVSLRRHFNHQLTFRVSHLSCIIHSFIPTYAHIYSTQ